MQSSYITSAQRAEQLPELGPPEIAFVGRSNCGKSSLLNALLCRNNLARTSSTPGRTQMVNFFAVEQGPHKVILADLPGYGYSATSRETRKYWQGLVAAYLLRPVLQEVLFLIDIRRALDGLDDQDQDLLAGLAARRPAAPVTVVLTKLDKVNQAEVAKATAQIKAELATGRIKVKAVVSVSTLKMKGVDQLREAVLGAEFTP